MSTLTGSSTLAQVWAAFDDNASYEEDSSATKARAFKTALLILMRRTPEKSGRRNGAGEYVDHSHESLQKLLSEVNAWLSVQPSTSGGGAGVIYADTSRFTE